MAKPKPEPLKMDARPHNGHPDYRVEVLPGVILGGQRLMIYDLLTRKVVVYAIARRVGKTTGWDHAQLELQTMKKGRFVSIFVAPDHAKAQEKFNVFLAAMGGDPRQNKGSMVESFHPSDSQDRWIRLRAIPYRPGPNGEQIETGNTGGLYRFCSGQYPYFTRIQGFQEPTDIVAVDEAQMQHMDMIDKVLNPMLLESDGILWIFGHPDHTQPGNTWYQEYFERGLLDSWQQDGWISRSFPIEAAPEAIISRRACARARREAISKETVIQEYDAKFLTNTGGVFDRQDEVFTLKPKPKSEYPAWLVSATAGIPRVYSWLHDLPQKGHRYGLSEDWAAKDDATVFSVFDLTTKRQVLLLQMLGYKGRDLEPILRLADDIVKHYNDAFIDSDENGIGFGYTDRQRRRYGDYVRGHVFSDAKKGQYVGRGQLLFGNAEIRMIDCKEQRHEFEKYRLIERKDGEGRVKSVVYSHPPGGHDDFVDAFLMATERLTREYQPKRRRSSACPAPGTHGWIKRNMKRRRAYEKRRGQQIV